MGKRAFVVLLAVSTLAFVTSTQLDAEPPRAQPVPVPDALLAYVKGVPLAVGSAYAPAAAAQPGAGLGHLASPRRAQHNLCTLAQSWVSVEMSV